MKVSETIWLAGIWGLQLAHGAPADFQYSRTLSGPTNAGTQICAVLLDASVMRHGATDLRDVRVLDATQTEQPRAIDALYTNEERVVREPLASRALTLKELEGNRIEASFELQQEGATAAAITIRTPLKDFVRAISVWGSADGQAWTLLLENAEIFDYSRYLDLRQTDLQLPTNSFRRFKLEIGNASEERIQPLIRLVQRGEATREQETSRAFDLLQTPFRMDGVIFFTQRTVVQQRERLRQAWPLQGFTAAENQELRATEITIRTARMPLTRLEVLPASQNFDRLAAVQAPYQVHDARQWRTIVEGGLMRANIPGYQKQALTLDFQEQRADELRLVIQNADNPPLSVTNLIAYGPIYRLVWLATPGITYRLVYGAKDLPQPAYDLAPLLAPIQQGLQPVLWELGAEITNAAFQAENVTLRRWLERPVVFSSALVVAALVLLLLLANALRKTPSQ